MEFKVGDRVRATKSCSGTLQGSEYEVVRNGDGIISIQNEEQRAEGCGGCNCDTTWELVEEASPEPIKQTKMTKKVIKVLAVDKKTGAILKNVTVVASDTTNAILKAYDVDAEGVYIRTSEEGMYEEEKPATVIMEAKK